MKYDGIDPKKFPLHLKELEFRYNHRHHDLYDAVVKPWPGSSREDPGVSVSWSAGERSRTLLLLGPHARPCDLPTEREYDP